MIKKSELKARAYQRALGLLELDRDKCFTKVTKTLQVSISSISRWAKEYRERGLQVIQDQPRSGRPMVIDGQQRAKITPWRAVNHPKVMLNGACAY